MEITSDEFALLKLGDYYPGSAKECKDPQTVLGKPLPMTDLLYWEVAIADKVYDYFNLEQLYSFWNLPYNRNALYTTTNQNKLYSFGIVPSTSPWDHDHQADDVFLVVLNCNVSASSINVKMMHKGQCLHEEILRWRNIQSHNGFGLLMDIDNRTLSVAYNTEESCRLLYTFENVDTSKGITPMFKVVDYANLYLMNPNSLQLNNLRPFLVKSLS